MGWSCSDVLRAPALPGSKINDGKPCQHLALEGSALHHITGRTDAQAEPFLSETQWPNTAHGMHKGPAHLILAQANACKSL